MSKPEILVVAKLPPFLMEPLRAAFVVHDRLHETDPAAFAQVAPSIRAIAASGESKVPKALIDQLPALEIVSVMGVGYDGIDVAAAKARKVVVTHTPDVLNDDVADLAIALMLSVAITSTIKALLLRHILKAPVSGFRWPLLWAVLAAIAAGTVFTSLPHRFEWMELVFGIPAIAAAYIFVLWRWAFGPEDRTLFRKLPGPEEATLPV